MVRRARTLGLSTCRICTLQTLESARYALNLRIAERPKSGSEEQGSKSDLYRGDCGDSREGGTPRGGVLEIRVWRPLSKRTSMPVDAASGLGGFAQQHARLLPNTTAAPRCAFSFSPKVTTVRFARISFSRPISIVKNALHSHFLPRANIHNTFNIVHWKPFDRPLTPLSEYSTYQNSKLASCLVGRSFRSRAVAAVARAPAERVRIC